MAQTEVRITTLSENTAGRGFLGEWGLSMLVEAGETRVLFDTGGGRTIIPNAKRLGADLAAADAIVLSHGHLDHTGGLKAVLEKTGPRPVIAHPDVWQAKIARHPGEEEQEIGIPFPREELNALGASFRLERGPVEIAPGIMTTGEVPMVTEYEEIDSGLFVREGDKVVPDTLRDDLALVISTEVGLVVLLGCAHRGMVNTLRHARNLTGEQRVHAVIGGTHLLHASPEYLALSIADLKEMGVAHVGVSHCTGFTASAGLLWEFGSGFFMNNAGNRLTLPFSG